MSSLTTVGNSRKSRSLPLPNAAASRRPPEHDAPCDYPSSGISMNSARPAGTAPAGWQKCQQLVISVPMPQPRRPARANVLRLRTKGALLRAVTPGRRASTRGTLTRMVRAGELERVAPGRYRQRALTSAKNHSLALARGAGALRRDMAAVGSAIPPTSGHNCLVRCGWPFRGTRVPDSHTPAATHTGFGAAVQFWNRGAPH